MSAIFGFVLGSVMDVRTFFGSGGSCDERYVFLNPVLRCDSDQQQKMEFVVFKNNLTSYIEQNVARGNAKTVAVYFRDLENGPWFGIGEQELFSPASMIKLPLLVAYYKRMEVDPQLMQRQITIDGPVTSQSEGSSLQAGATYTVEELLERMIVESDNAALPILFAYLQQFYPDEDVFAETLAAMGIAASEGSEDDFLTVKRYASIYRILYNASFLNKEMSQRALDLLTKTKSPLGIDDAIPPGILVAHKFGTREQFGLQQLHDCGIVYFPDEHYILCIMTRGNDIEKLSVLIRDIASMVYEEIVDRAK